MSTGTPGPSVPAAPGDLGGPDARVDHGEVMERSAAPAGRDRPGRALAVIWGGLAFALLLCAAVQWVTPHLLSATAGGTVPVLLAQILALLLVLVQLAGLAGLCFYGWHALFTTPLCVIAALRGRRDAR
ncbi:hypothetical protein ACRWOO_18420 [Streptomyces sp. NEAU-PBA10]|uniref:Integral membrane protein n=2 Tax=Streptomyces tremellae TaxID=1124239 RepID=A0ABP7E4G1_9ACTN